MVLPATDSKIELEIENYAFPTLCLAYRII